jgi:hypothetical protein
MFLSKNEEWFRKEADIGMDEVRQRIVYTLQNAWAYLRPLPCMAGTFCNAGIREFEMREIADYPKYT